jgi:hypothetical protein
LKRDRKWQSEHGDVSDVQKNKINKDGMNREEK